METIVFVHAFSNTLLHFFLKELPDLKFTNWSTCIS